MKGLSLTQPWATLVAMNAKQVETRSWSTSHRGLIAIHAAKGLGPVGGKRGLIEQCDRPTFVEVLRGFALYGNHENPFPLGAIVCVARLVACKSTNGETGSSWINKLTLQERRFGNYDMNRYGWFLENIIALPEPVECKGALSLWEVPRDVEARINEYLYPAEEPAASQVYGASQA